MSSALDRAFEQLRPPVLAGMVAAVFALTALAAWQFGFRGALEEQSTLTLRLDQLRKAAQDDGHLNAEIERTNAQLEVLDARLAFVDSSRGDTMVSTLMRALDELARVHGVEILRLDPSGSNEVNGFIELPLVVQARGSYFALYAWTSQLDERIDNVTVKDVEIRPAEANGERMMTLVMAMYRSVTEAAS